MQRTKERKLSKSSASLVATTGVNITSRTSSDGDGDDTDNRRQTCRMQELVEEMCPPLATHRNA